MNPFFALACVGPQSVATIDDNGLDGVIFEDDTAVEYAPGIDDTGEPPEDTAGEDTAGDAEDYASFYADGVVQEIRLSLTQDTIQALNRQVRNGSFEYLSGDVQINGRDFTNVGVRIKGSSTLRDFDSKPSLKIKFDAFEDGKDFAGLERVTLNNMVEDPTQTKEVMNYRVFREMGLPASRANHAAVFVNDEYYGLYTNLEAMDDEWLKLRFDDPSGDLWEANDYADFTRAGLNNWELASGDGDESQLQAVADALKGDDPYVMVDLFLDIEQFQRWWVTRLITGDVDGYPYSPNDAYIYADPNDGFRFVFMPWGVDESWSPDTPAYWRSVTGQLADMCLDDNPCEADLLLRAAEQLDSFALLEPVEWLAKERTVIEPFLASDARRPFSLADVERATDKLAEYMLEIPEDLRREMGL